MDSWAENVKWLSECDMIPGARENARLLRSVQQTWGGRIASRTSHVDLLFTLLDDKYPFRASVQVTWEANTFTFRLDRIVPKKGDALVGADRCHKENAPAVLNSFLEQLIAE